MNIRQAKEFFKDKENKKYPNISKSEFVKKFIAESGAQPNPKPSAVFMAGLPGAGKTEFSKNLVKLVGGTKAVRIDMDEIASQIEGYQPENADKYREAATRLLNATLDRVLDRKLEFILDGTFSSKNALSNIERAIRHGYSIKVVYIIQNPKIAWEFTKARERVEHRSITIDGFVSTYFRIIDNIIKLEPLAKQNRQITLDLITKNNNNEIGSWIPNVKENIDKLLKTNYNNKTLKEYIDD